MHKITFTFALRMILSFYIKAADRFLKLKVTILKKYKEGMDNMKKKQY